MKRKVGRPAKYDFGKFKVGEIRKYKDTNCDYLGKCARFFAKTRSLDWKFKCFTTEDTTNLLRIK